MPSIFLRDLARNGTCVHYAHMPAVIEKDCNCVFSFRKSGWEELSLLISSSFILALYLLLSFNICIRFLGIPESVIIFCTLPSPYCVSAHIVYLLVWHSFWGQLKHYLHRYYVSCCDKKSNRYNYTCCISRSACASTVSRVCREAEGTMTSCSRV